ncbi:MAG: FixH family protein [Pseudomonadota bacterium]
MSDGADGGRIAVKKFTGWHMLAVMVTFFGVIITVNITMAVYASTSWTGLLAKNGYVASIDYHRDEAQRRAAEALGWSIATSEDGGLLTVELRDNADKALEATVVASASDGLGKTPDVLVELARAGPGRWRSTGPLPKGRWVVKTEITSGASVVTWRSVHEVGRR